MNYWRRPCKVSLKSDEFISRQRSKLILTFIFFIAVMFAPYSASFADQKSTSQSNIALLDFEILLLRSEIALRKGEQGQFLVNMFQLSQKAIPDQFRSRYEALVFQQNLIESPITLNHDMPSIANARDVVILLPMSSGLAQASNVIIDVFNHSFVGRRLHFIDTDLYEDVSELVNLVKLFNPGLIIGPLERQKAQSFYQYGLQVPIVSFVSLDMNRPGLFLPESNTKVFLQALEPILKKLDVNKILWLSDGSGFSLKLFEEIEAWYAQQGIASKTLDHFYLEGGVDKSLGLGLGVIQSNVRAGWLQRTIEQSLEVENYVRKDKALLVGVLNQNQALQVKPLLNFYGRDVQFLWLPSDLPDIQAFRNSRASWQKTHVVFPAHFSQQIVLDDSHNLEGAEVGLIHALAEHMVALVKHADLPLPFQVQTDAGHLVVNRSGRYYFLPSLFFLDQDRFKQTVLDEIYQDPMGL